MKAIRVREWGGPEVLKIEDVPEPKPGAGQVLVRVRAAGVNPVETYIRAGSYAVKPDLPYTPGSDAAGVVVAVGEGAGSVAIGARVYTSGALGGTYAEQVLCAAEQIHPLPDNVSFAQGAALGVAYGTAFYALFLRGQAVAGETVLVHGASGGVGTAAVQLARALGMTVIGTAGSERGRNLVREQGVHHVLDHHRDGYLEQIPALTNGHGVDLILEMLANVNLGKDLTILAKYGRVVVIGSRGRVEIDPRDTMPRDASILGMTLRNATPEQLRRIHAALAAGLENETLRPVVGAEIPLADAARAHREVMAGESHGKIVLVP